MMNNKKAKIILNGAVLAVMAALGITVYQIGTSSSKEEIMYEEVKEEAKEESNTEPQISEETKEEALVDADTSQVKASMEESEEAEGTEDTEELSEETPVETAANPQAAPLNLPDVNFSEETLMEWPIHGNILVDYSMDSTVYFPTLDQYRLSPAIAVQADEGAPVMSAVNGTVYSVEETAKTGTTVTMELGNGYQAVYGQLKDLNVSEGDTVEKGAIIGYVNAPTKYYSEEGSNLYFAMKKDGKPIDPIAYLP
ncbi:MAG: M23 family metallopeptidase [Eubacteriales bacterium]|nr:M23 family metallopeptidase [Eubacteriales bacterium]